MSTSVPSFGAAVILVVRLFDRVLTPVSRPAVWETNRVVFVSTRIAKRSLDSSARHMIFNVRLFSRSLLMYIYISCCCLPECRHPSYLRPTALTHPSDFRGGIARVFMLVCGADRGCSSLQFGRNGRIFSTNLPSVSSIRWQYSPVLSVQRGNSLQSSWDS